MTKAILVCASIFTLVTAVAPVLAGEQAARETHGPRNTSSRPNFTEGDCETRIEKLAESNAEGEERLAAKNEVIDFCASQYKHDNTIKRLVEECAKFEEQPVVKQQFVAECQLAAFKYANALRALKTEYKK
jgi:hypothetical protein